MSEQRQLKKLVRARMAELGAAERAALFEELAALVDAAREVEERAVASLAATSG